jgi:hypothetical protein
VDPQTLTKEEAASLLYTVEGDGFLAFTSAPFPLSISFGDASPLRLIVATAGGGRPLDALAEAMDALEADAGSPDALAAALSAWRACRS